MLTPAGTALLARAERVVDAELGDVFGSRLSTTEVAELTALLRSLRAAMRDGTGRRHRLTRSVRGPVSYPRVSAILPGGCGLVSSANAAGVSSKAKVAAIGTARSPSAAIATIRGAARARNGALPGFDAPANT
jgi:hypothetical protein